MNKIKKLGIFFPKLIIVALIATISWLLYSPLNKHQKVPLISEIVHLIRVEQAKTNAAPAQFSLALDYERGRGTEVDYAKAKEWYEKAAAQNEARAINNLGNMYTDGRGVKKDYKKAFEYYKKAASLDEVNGIYNYGHSYSRGRGVKKNEKEAIKLYKLAAEKNHTNAIHNLGYAYQTGNGVKKDVKEAIRLFEKAASLGYLTSYNRLGYSYFNGIGVSKDVNKAIDWWEKGAEAGDVDSQLHLGNLYLKGRGITKNYRMAHKWYAMAADNDDPYGLYYMGLSHSEDWRGIGYYLGDYYMIAAYIRAYNCFAEAAELNHSDSQYKLGAIHQDIGNYAKSYKWYALSYHGNKKKIAYLDVFFKEYALPEEIKEGKKLVTEWYEEHPEFQPNANPNS